MPLTVGSKLGPYEILSPLGAGGMGEVYRARDPRLEREVAIKVLPASLSQDPDRLRRFEQEAKAAGLLNHPNITAVYDVGSHEGAPYVVSELLEGETLRQRLATGALAPRKAAELAAQIAQGLAAAHEKGIVHRDLKPENIFISQDGRAKILDFGLAKLIQREPEAAQTSVPTASPGTEPGVVMGTVGYMSPEQVKGQAVDHRSDIFSFGAILYEMLSGRRAFQRDTAAEAMTAILKEEPPELLDSGTKISPALDRVVRHCLEKSPSERFQSARDLAFDLQSASSAAVAPVMGAAPAARGRSRTAVAALALLALYTAGVYWLAHRWKPSAPPLFRQLTFRRGTVGQARFSPDGQTVLYSAAWEGKPFTVYSTRSGSLESSPLGIPSGGILAVSPSGQLALQLARHSFEPYVTSGTLAEAPLVGGEAPRERLHDVQWADWSPDGKRLAIVHDAGGRNRLESPVGNVLYESSGWIGNPRFSPRGDAIALLDHWARIGDLGTVVVVSLSGGAKKLSEGWDSLQGLAWRPDGKEIWFTGTKAGGNRSLYAVTPSGQLRVVFRQTGSLTLSDISAAGEVLLVNEDLRVGIISQAPGEPTERDLSWLDFSALRDMSPDGRRILFDESAEGGGEEGTTFLRDTDGSLPMRLSIGYGMGLSPDGRLVVSSVPTDPSSLRLLPVGAGEMRIVTHEPFPIIWAEWLPDGKQILLSGGETGHGARLYLQDISGGPARPVGPEGVHLIPYSNLVSPDGKWVPAVATDRSVSLYPLDGGKPLAINGLAPEEVPCGWDATGSALFVYRPGELPAKVSKLDIQTGTRKPWKELMPGDSTGVRFLRAPHFTRDGLSYAYSYSRVLSQLYLVRGLS